MTTATEKYTTPTIQAPGREVTPKVYSALKGISENTLGAWRLEDQRAGRNEALPGKPVYRRYGRAIRYWLEPGSYDPAMLAIIPATRYKPRKKTVQAAVTV